MSDNLHTEYHYFAFISYKRDDVKWAKWLQKKLETYKLPSTVHKEHPLLPTKVSPIFRDVTDLGAGILKENLREELKASKFLIVICSPESAKSDWVGEEISDFISFGRADRIIPFIVSGSPNSNNKSECFHPALKNTENELLGINVQEIGKNKAFIKIVAKLLDIRFDELWNRERRRQQRKKVRKAIIASIFITAFVALLIYSYPHKKYYADIAEFSDSWKSRGINEVSKEDIKHMNKHYCFITSMGKLQRIVERNSAGWLAGDIIVYDDTKLYDSNVSYNEIYQYNEVGALEQVISSSFSDDSHFDIKDGNYISSAKGMLDQDVRTDIKRLVVFRNKYGFANKILYKKHNGDDSTPGTSQNGVHGEEYELDSLGHVTEVYYLAEDGVTRCVDKYGIYEMKMFYDDAGNRTSCKFYDRTGGLCENKFGIAVYQFRYDSYHNICEIRFYNKSMIPTPNDVGAYGEVSVYNDRGFQEEQTYLGSNFSPAACKDGYVTMRRTFYDPGKIRTETFCDAEGNPVLPYSDNYSTVSYTYDNHGWITSVELFDTEGNRCIGKDGYSKAIFAYDQSGNVKETNYFGEDDRPCLNSRGFHREMVYYEAWSKDKTICYYGIDDKLCTDCNGVSQEEVKLDDLGRDIEHQFLDIEGNPIADRYGIYTIKVEYNEYGALSRICNYGFDGKFRNNENGTAVIEYKYDFTGDMIEEIHYDALGNRLDEKQ